MSNVVTDGFRKVVWGRAFKLCQGGWRLSYVIGKPGKSLKHGSDMTRHVIKLTLPATVRATEGRVSRMGNSEAGKMVWEMFR